MTKIKDHIKEALILIRDKLVNPEKDLKVDKAWRGNQEEVDPFQAKFVLRLMNTMLDESGQLLISEPIRSVDHDFTPNPEHTSPLSHSLRSRYCQTLT